MRKTTKSPSEKIVKDIKRATRKHYSSGEKIRNVLDGQAGYGRTDAAQSKGRYIYNHIQCAPMLFWLAEALECESALLKAAYNDVTATNTKGARQCAALRDHLGWQKIEAAITDFEYSKFQRLRIKWASHQN